MSTNPSNLPLIIEMSGPMAFKLYEKTLEIWLPVLADKHQAAIGSDVQSQAFNDSTARQNYVLSGLDPFSGVSLAHNPASSIPFEVTPKTLPNTFFIHLTLPKPQAIKGLSPVSCEIYDRTPTHTYLPRPTGFQLTYEKTGQPVLYGSNGGNPVHRLQFDPSPSDLSNQMFIKYAPFNFDRTEAENDFAQLATMLGLNLKVKLEETTNEVMINEFSDLLSLVLGPAHDCKAPNITLIN